MSLCWTFSLLLWLGSLCVLPSAFGHFFLFFAMWFVYFPIVYFPIKHQIKYYNFHILCFFLQQAWLHSNKITLSFLTGSKNENGRTTSRAEIIHVCHHANINSSNRELESRAVKQRHAQAKNLYPLKELGVVYTPFFPLSKLWGRGDEGKEGRESDR